MAACLLFGFGQSLDINLSTLTVGSFQFEQSSRYAPLPLDGCGCRRRLGQVYRSGRPMGFPMIRLADCFLPAIEG